MNVRLLSIVAAALAPAALLAGCGGDDDATPVATPTLVRTASSTATQPSTSSASPGAQPSVTKELFDVSKSTVTPSGLRYIDQKVGAGESPTINQSVTVNYTGKLAADGKVFDTTQGKQPITFGMAQVIKGFSEGLSTMKVGGKRTVYIPAALGYGARGAPPLIPANADLVFEIELIAIK